MTAAGYDALLCGKMHYDRARRYGFCEIEPIGDNSFKTGKGNRRNPDQLESKRPLSSRFNDFHPGENSGILNHDRQVTAGVVKFLGRRKADDKPFFLIAGYLAPHFPLIVPEKYWDHYKGKVPMPVIPPGSLAAQPLNYQHLRAGFDMTEVPDDVVRRGRELYYGLTEWFDNEVGKVLAALDDSGLAENTVIIYSTDHGENHPPQRELYDMQADPGELDNLAGKPEHAKLIEKLEARLIEELGEHPETIEKRCRADYAKGYQREKPAAAGRKAEGRKGKNKPRGDRSPKRDRASE